MILLQFSEMDFSSIIAKVSSNYGGKLTDFLKQLRNYFGFLGTMENVKIFQMKLDFIFITQFANLS